MEPRRIGFDNPDRVVPGMSGDPLAPSYFVQIREGSLLGTLRIQKRQLSMLAIQLSSVVDEITKRGTPADEPWHTLDVGPLDLPLFPLFDVGTMTISWDPEATRVRLELFEDTSDSDLSTQVVAVAMPLAMVSTFAGRAAHLTQSGLPLCPLCTQPLHPSGHLCPRADGYIPAGADPAR